MTRKKYHDIIFVGGVYELIDEEKKKQEDYERREAKRMKEERKQREDYERRETNIINKERKQQQIYKEQDDYER